MEQVSSTPEFPMKSKNPQWHAELQSLSGVSQSEFSVLLLGPSGSGKDIIAQAIHKNSQRQACAFVSVNCSALTESLIESELFGHVKGSFTGALGDRKGAFESARFGTLFLDEIGDLSYNLQAKLLRALENNEIRPVGSDKIVKTNVRIIAATHQNLDQKIQAGEFRSDLYYRLNVVSIFTPALKDRPEDFEEILYSFAKEMRVRFSYDAIQRLKAHTWPGNIRELRNLVARASALFTHRQIDLEKAERLLGGSSFHPHPLRETAASGQVSVIKEVERQIILKKLETNKGNQRKTAHELGMPKSTLNDRLRQYNINLGDFKKSSPPVFT